MVSTIESFERQILQFTNAAHSINDKFKTTIERVAKMEKQVSEFFNSGSLMNLAKHSGEDELRNLPSSMKGNPNIDMSE